MEEFWDEIYVDPMAHFHKEFLSWIGQLLARYVQLLEDIETEQERQRLQQHYQRVVQPVNPVPARSRPDIVSLTLSTRPCSDGIDGVLYIPHLLKSC
jgi:hypothetical protein